MSGDDGLLYHIVQSPHDELWCHSLDCYPIHKQGGWHEVRPYDDHVFALQ